jgi:hypothetical protein
MVKNHKNRSTRRSSQSSTTAILTNNCNNIVIAILGTTFAPNRQNCRVG